MTSTHSAAQLVKVNSPLQDFQVPTRITAPTKIKIAVSYVALSPLDVWRSRYGLLIKDEDLPKTLGGTFSGNILEIGKQVPQAEGELRLKTGDLVSGWAAGLGGSMEEIIDVEWWCVSKLSNNLDLASAATLGDNLTTAIWSLSEGGLSLSLSCLEASEPASKEENILVWGGSSSVGQFSIQILKDSGYKNVYSTASSKHHQLLVELGAKRVFDYNNQENCLSEMLEEMTPKGLDGFTKVLDCIGDVDGSLRKIKKVVSKNQPSVVAAMLPYIEKGKEVYMSIEETGLQFPSTSAVVGVRTHFYWHSDFNKNNIQPRIIPNLIAKGVVKPNKVKLVGNLRTQSLAERFQEGLRSLEEGVSGERVVVQVQ